jgi:hypothetical protein
MARSKLPGALERRHLVEKDLPPERARAIAEAYLEAERLVEAVDFLRIADAGERLDELRRHAISQGDVFLARSVATAQKRDLGREDWHALAASAEGHGLESYAIEARRQAERGE